MHFPSSTYLLEGGGAGAKRVQLLVGRRCKELRHGPCRDIWAIPLCARLLWVNIHPNSNKDVFYTLAGSFAD